MSNIEIELNPVDFITIGTIGPKGKRVFHLQAGANDQIVTFTIEKEQAWALSEAIDEFLDDLAERYDTVPEVDIETMDMDLREPIQPLFRIAQMGLGYDEDSNHIVLVANEMVIEEDEDEIGTLDDAEAEESGVARLWCSPEQLQALSLIASGTVKAGRADPNQNGRIIYYWT